MDLIINILLNSFDIFLIYNLYFGLMNNKIKFNIKDLFVGLLWGTMNGLFVNFNNLTYLKFVLYISAFLYIWNLCRKKLHELLIIYIIINLIIAVVQVFILGASQLFAHNNIYLFQQKESYIALLSQLLTAMCVILICRLPIYKIYEVIQENILLKFLIYIMIIVIFVLFHRTIKLTEMVTYIPILMFFLYGIIHSAKSISYYTKKFPAINHELRNVMMGIYLSANYNSDLSKIRGEINDYIVGLGIEIDENKLVVSDVYSDSIKNFIQAKENDSEKKIILEINYFQDNKLIPISSIIQILGILIDNAIEATSADNIKVHLLCTEYNLIIEVLNEYEGVIDLTKLISKKNAISSKKRGYGLQNLKRIVKKYKGKIESVHLNGVVSFKIII